ADEQGEHGSPEERSRRHKSDLDRVEADGREISRQDDDREAVAEPAQTSRGVEQKDVRAWWWHGGSNRNRDAIALFASGEGKTSAPPFDIGGRCAVFTSPRERGEVIDYGAR